jgi:uncharacterized protein (TIGR00369 family)
VHGGSIAALIDSAAGSAIAAGCAPDSDRIMGTIDMQVHFLERGKGTALIADAKMVRAGRAVGVASVDVRDEAGTLVAMGTATYRMAHLAPAGTRTDLRSQNRIDQFSGVARRFQFPGSLPSRRTPSALRSTLV